VRGGSLFSVTVQTDDHEVARRWLELPDAPALEGIVAKRADHPYQPGKRSWVKVKRYETADLVVGGYVGDPEKPTSLLLGAYDETGQLRFVGAARPPKQRWGSERRNPLLELAAPESFVGQPSPGRGRWDSHRFEEWFPLKPELVCEVAYSRADGTFLRHGARFVKWRFDKEPTGCLLAEIFPNAPPRGLNPDKEV
jgi:ATP-dependent DNA ligase